jgi:hypothetical protein
MRIALHLSFIASLWLLLGWNTVVRAADLPQFEIVAKDGRLAPSQLEVPAGQRIKLVVKNEGRTPIEFENAAMRIEKVLAPGASSFVILPKLKPGSYVFVDEFHEDTAKMTVIAK